MTFARAIAAALAVAAGACGACARPSPPGSYGRSEPPISWSSTHLPLTGRWTIARRWPVLPEVLLDLSEGRYLLRFTTDRPSTVKITLTSEEPHRVLGGFDLPTPLCVAVPPLGKVHVEARPIGEPPAWIDLVLDRTSRDVSPGPARWTCPPSAAAPPTP